MDGESAVPGYRSYQVPVFDEAAEQAGAALPKAVGSEFLPAVEALPRDRPAGEPFQGREPRRRAAPEADFAAIKFQRENTLLTNAESYAASIREEADLYVRQLRREVQALDEQAQQRYEEAARIRAEAEQQAEQLVADARESAEEIREQARLEGFEEGRAEGLKRRYEEAGVHLERLDLILHELGEYRRRVIYYAEKDGIRLAMLMARKLLRQELTINRKAVWNVLAATLREIEDKGTFSIWLSTEDYRFAAAARPALERYLAEDQAITFRARATLQPGDVLIETDRDVIDLSLATQLHHLEGPIRQMLAEHEARANAGDEAAERPGAATPAASGRGDGTSPAHPTDPAAAGREAP
jgi:flagellar assembly protein FliH